MGESVLMGACARTIVGITLLPFTVLKARFEVIFLLVIQIPPDRLSWATCIVINYQLKIFVTNFCCFRNVIEICTFCFCPV